MAMGEMGGLSGLVGKFFGKALEIRGGRRVKDKGRSEILR